jgi:hypothetical protein
MYFFLYMKKRKKNTSGLLDRNCTSLPSVLFIIFGVVARKMRCKGTRQVLSHFMHWGTKRQQRKRKTKQNNLSPSLEDSDHAAASRSVVNPIMQVLASVIRRQCILINIECGADTYIQYIYRKKMREIGHTRHKQRIWGRLTQQLAARFKKVDVR